MVKLPLPLPAEPIAPRPPAAFLLRHRWGLVTLAAAAFTWGVGGLWTPAPELIGGTLIAVGLLTLLALGRLRRRWSGAFALGQRRRTHTSLALYGASLALSSFFLAGLFVVSGSATVVGNRAAAEAASGAAAVSLVPALASVPTLYAPRSGSLRLLSFNVWHGYPRSADREERYGRLRGLIAELDPDVVLLQEAWSTRRFGSLTERLSRDLGLGSAYARANGSLRYIGFEEGLAILSRHPISEVRRLALGPRTPPWEMRAALGATIDIPGTGPLEVWNTHLSHSDPFARDGQARSLAAALAGSRVALLAGDFNASESTAAVTEFAALELRPLLSEGIDHLLASPALREEWRVVRAEARRFGEVTGPVGLGSRPAVSDHPALLVELERRLSPATATVAGLGQ